jgi:hypothetical protein
LQKDKDFVAMHHTYVEKALDVKTLPTVNTATAWEGLGVGNEKDGRFYNREDVGLLAPLVTFESYSAYLHRDCASKGEGKEVQDMRPVIKGAQSTVNKPNIELHFKEFGNDVVGLRAKFEHSMPSNNKKSAHYGFLYVWVKLNLDPNADMPTAISVESASCTCTAGEGKSCWHIAALLFCSTNLYRPAASLVPQSSTANEMAWNNVDLRRANHFDKTLPLACLPLRNNKRKNIGKLCSPGMSANLAGGGDRLAVGYESIAIRPEHIEFRNDPEVISIRERLYKASERSGGVQCAAVVHWPAENSKCKRFKVCPITSGDYLSGSIAQRRPAVTAIIINHQGLLASQVLKFRREFACTVNCH